MFCCLTASTARALTALYMVDDDDDDDDDLMMGDDDDDDDNNNNNNIIVYIYMAHSCEKYTTDSHPI